MVVDPLPSFGLEAEARKSSYPQVYALLGKSIKPATRVPFARECMSWLLSNSMVLACWDMCNAFLSWHEASNGAKTRTREGALGGVNQIN